jgi:hypothetical protein
MEIYGGRYDISVAHLKMVLHRYIPMARLKMVLHRYVCHLFQRVGPHISVAHAYVVCHGYPHYAWCTPNACAMDMGA